MNKNYFAEWLEGELSARGWTQTELARRAGMSRAAISMLLSGRNHPKAETCIALARALKLPPEIVLKVADHLPERPTGDEAPYLNQIVDLMKRMDPEQQRHLYEYALWWYRREYD